MSDSVLSCVSWKAEDSEKFKTMVQFECRGLEPVDFQPQVRASLVYSDCAMGKVDFSKKEQ